MDAKTNEEKQNRGGKGRGRDQSHNGGSNRGGGSSPGGGGRGKEGKVAPVSPAKARLERRANDEKIIRNIKIAFMSIVIVAVVGVALALFLYIYRPAVATVGGEKINQFEYSYFLHSATQYSETAELTDEIRQQALDYAAELKIKVALAKEKGVTMTDEDKQSLEADMEYLESIAASSSASGGTALTGDEFLRQNLGVSKPQYRKIVSAGLLGDRVVETEKAAITVPDEDAQARYDENIANYDEVTVRHILFLYEGKEDTAAEDAATEEAEAAEAGTDGEDGAESEVEAPPARTREESKALAEDTVARINAGEDMAALVQELSEDTDLTNEGIYTFKKTDPYEQGFIDWAYDPERKVGDVGIAETSYGYHVMRLEDHTVQTFEEVKESIVDEIKTEQVDAIVEGWKTEPRFQVQVNQGVYDSMTL